MVLYSITGILPEPVFAEKGDNSKKIRAGMPMGAKIELKGRDMYLFMDKLINCVLPRIVDFESYNPVGDGKGSFSLRLPSAAMGYFPDIEPYVDRFPRLFETNVKFNTSGCSDDETILCLSAFQLPFKDTRIIEKEKVKISEDPWEQIKLAKTREERKLLSQAIMEAKKKRQ
jgi:large subunit ribosomal protein L5